MIFRVEPSELQEGVAPGDVGVEIDGIELGGDLEMLCGEKERLFLPFFRSIFEESEALPVPDPGILGVDLRGCFKRGERVEISLQEGEFPLGEIAERPFVPLFEGDLVPLLPRLRLRRTVFPGEKTGENPADRVCLQSHGTFSVKVRIID